ncbi:tyrosine-type recombinase/integrase [Thalassorhabdomicrobium marinisediminis]|uniref:Recombinase XerD n=1 Tax=Thalassorhabdomicrobium marinisediminis TaxID=2170577 RepID=A0A2T7FT43_9RHOB|nr:tyrosine-type recombinase/integrase [Thalassorhabdomicrobium marinisediminis]PVA05347.1 recombinase XerD [Thalassorhabdomicrobium marinisediminis]
MASQFDRQSVRVELISKLSTVPTSRRQALIAEYRKRSEAAFAASTLRNYRMTIRLFTEWCHREGHCATLPIEPRTVAAWIDAMGGKLAANTIETRLWAIAELHRSEFLPSPTRHRLVDLALKAVKRKYGTMTRQAPPLCKKEVIATIGRLGASRQDIRDKAVLWIATDSWCRASEIVAFRVKDLQRQEDGSSLLFVARSKTDQNGQGGYAFLSKRGSEAVIKWIEMANLRADDPILTKSQSGATIKPLDPATLSRIIKRCTGRTDVSAHSTRVGGVHDAFRLGCDLSSIMVAGRWSSPEMPARYGRRILASQSAAAKVSSHFNEVD